MEKNVLLDVYKRYKKRQRSLLTDKKFQKNFLEMRRQAVHATGVFTIPILMLLGPEIGKIFLGAMVAFILLYALYRKNREKIKNRIFIGEWFYSLDEFMERKICKFERKTEFPLQGALTFYAGVFIVSLFFPQKALFASIMVLALGDSVSTFVGKIWGRHKLYINENKSWEGSLAFFLAALFSFSFFTDPVHGLMFAMFMTFVEGLPGHDDNVSIPIITAILLSI